MKRTTGLIVIVLLLASSSHAEFPLSLDPSKVKQAIAGWEEKLGEEDNAELCLRLAWARFLYRVDMEEAEALAMKAEKLVETDPSEESAYIRYKSWELLANIYTMSGDYAAAFAELLKLIKVERPETELYMYAAARLNITPERRKALCGAYDYCRENFRGEALKAHATFNQALLLLENGDTVGARERFAGLGTVAAWMVIGAFNNDQNVGFDEAYAPESEIDYEKSYDSKRWQIKWRRLEYFGLDGAVNFNKIFYPADWGVAYALTFVYSPHGGLYAVRLGADDNVKLWLNDGLLLSEDSLKASALDQFVVAARLHAGWNKLLVKVGQKNGSWKLLLRITNADGSPSADLEYATDAGLFEPAKRRNGDGASVAESDEVVGNLRSVMEAKLEDGPRDELVLYYLAWWLADNDFRDEAISSYEKLVKLNPRCPFYRSQMAVAYLADGRAPKALSARIKALKLYPDYAHAHYKLGAYYYGKQLYDRAREELEAARKLSPRWPNVLLYQALVYEAKGWEEDAYLTAREALELEPQLPWANNNRGYYAKRLGYLVEAEEYYRLALEYDFDYGQARENVISLVRSRGDYDGVAKLYREFLSIEPMSNGRRLAFAQSRRAAGDFAGCEELCRQVIKQNPENPYAYEVLGRASYLQGKRNKALEYYKLALRYKPDNLVLNEYLAFLEPTTNPLFAEYDLAAEEVRQVIGKAPAADAYPRASAVILLDRAITSLNRDGSSTTLVHQVIKIFNKKGRARYAQVRVPADRSLKIKRAISIAPDGTEQEATAISNGVISMPALEDGSIIEYKYIHDVYQGEWLKENFQETFYFQDNDPVLVSEYILSLPKEKELSVHIQGSVKDYSKKQAGERVIHIWRAEDMDALYKETRQPPFTDLAALVKLSTIPDWDEIMQWEKSLIKDQFEIDKDIRDKVRQLTAGKKEAEEKARAIYNFIVNEIRYLYLDTGIFGKKPNKSANIFANRFGDCKDKATLMIAMFKEAGIKAHYACLRTRDAGRLVMEVPSSQTNHAIVYIPSQHGFRQGRFLDGTAQYLGYDYLPGDDQGVAALVLTDDGYEMIRTPVSPEDGTSLDNHYQVELNAAGHISAAVRSRNAGLFAMTTRNSYRVSGRRREELGQYVNRLVAGAELGEFEFTGMKDLDQDVVIDFDFKALDFAKVGGEEQRFRPITRYSLTRSFANKEERFYDVELYYRHVYAAREEYSLPAGYEIAELPEDADYDSPFFSYTARFRAEEGKVVCDKEIRIKALRVPLEDYADFRELCRKCDRYEEKEIVLRKMQ